MITIRKFDDAARRVVEGVDDLLTIGAQASKHLERRGLHDRARLVRDEIIAVASGEIRVPVVGEFKSGKSSLLNALLGTTVLGADPVRSTAVCTEVRFADPPTFSADISEDGRALTSVALDAEGFRDVALVPEPTIDGVPVRALCAGIPSPLLSSGLRFVDTPSVSGGLSSPVAGAVMAELLQSQMWVMTTNATQELTGPELELINVGASLCPIVLVVATRCDVAPDWRRIVELDAQHLATLDLSVPPVVIPVATPLRAAAIRLASPPLDQESGLPLLMWTLTRTASAMVRLTALRTTTASVVDELEALDRSLTGEIDTLLDSGERAVILASAQRARDRCERLAMTARSTLDSAIFEFRKRVRRDLEDRIATVRRQLLDDLAQAGERVEWAWLERRAQAEVNRLLAEHLATLREELRRLVDSMLTDLGFEPGELRILDGLMLAERPETVVPQLDQPAVPRSPSSSRLQSVLLPARVGITGASAVSVGITTEILAGLTAILGVAFVPIAVIGAGWWLRKRERIQTAIPWKLQAAAEINRFVGDCHQVIARCSDDMRDEILGQLPRLAEQCFSSKVRELNDEIERLTVLASDRANVHRDQAQALEDERAEVRLVATHARRLDHRLHTPTLEHCLPGADDVEDQLSVAPT